MTSAPVHYRLLIDWAANGTFTDTVDDVSASIVASSGISVEYGRDTARSTAPPMIGTSSAVLWNQDRGFSPENPSSGRFLQIRPGRPYRVEAQTGTTSPYREAAPYRAADPYRGTIEYPLFLGATARMAQRTDWGDRVMELSALSTMTLLQRTVISTSFVGDARIDGVIGLILDAAGWPSGNRSLSIGDALVHGYWVDERTAWDCLLEAVATEGAGAVLYQDTTGKLIFQNRSYRASAPRSTTSQYVLHDGVGAPPSGLGTVLRYQHLEYDPRWEDLVTRATVATHQRVLSSTTDVIWKGPTPITPTPSGQTFWARPDDPFYNLVAPVNGTDYTVSGGSVLITVAGTNGNVVQLDVKATGGSPTVTNLQLRAQAYRKVGETTVEYAVTPAIPSDEKTLEIRAWPMLDVSHAAAIAESYVLRYADPRPTVDVAIVAVDATHRAAAYDVQISDRVTIVNQHLGISAPYWVERIRHEIGAGGRHTVTLSCEPVIALGTLGDRWDVGAWDTAVWGY